MDNARIEALFGRFGHGKAFDSSLTIPLFDVSITNLTGQGGRLLQMFLLRVHTSTPELDHPVVCKVG